MVPVSAAISGLHERGAVECRRIGGSRVRPSRDGGLAGAGLRPQRAGGSSTAGILGPAEAQPVG